MRHRSLQHGSRRVELLLCAYIVVIQQKYAVLNANFRTQSGQNFVAWLKFVSLTFCTLVSWDEGKFALAKWYLEVLSLSQRLNHF